MSEERERKACFQLRVSGYIGFNLRLVRLLQRAIAGDKSKVKKVTFANFQMCFRDSFMEVLE